MERLSLFADQAALAVESVRTFDDVAAVLLGALAAAAEDEHPDLAAALAQVPPPTEESADLVELAEVLAALGRAGAAERQLAVRVLRDVLRYTRGLGG
jgi:hypothetical protein